MSAMPHENMTVQEYLEFERESDAKHEYLNGEVFAMAGASANYNLVTGNTYAALHAQLRKRPCLIFTNDMRVHIPATDLYTYPDIVIVCNAPQYEDKGKDTLLNPTLIIEVLSPSTENYDRGRKFQHYRSLSSLKEYILISQENYHIEHYIRQENKWILTDIMDATATINLPSTDCTLTMSDIYEKVDFDLPTEE